MNKLRRFTELWIQHGKDASKAAQELRPGFPYKRPALWATASRLLKNARKHPSFPKWVAEAEGVTDSHNPLTAARIESEASREFARQAGPVSQNRTAPQKRLSPPRTESLPSSPPVRDSYLPAHARWARGGDGLTPDDFRVAEAYVRPKRRRRLIQSYASPRIWPPMPQNW